MILPKRLYMLCKKNRPGLSFYLSLFMLIIYSTSGFAKVGDVRVEKITCEYHQNPQLVATETPRFGWLIQSGKKSRGTLQSAYAIQIFTHIKGKEVKVWDSGKVYSARSQQVKYNGKEKLLQGKAYTWRVKVWDTNDAASPWSNRNSFRIAPVNLANKAKWIGAINRKEANIPEGRVYHGISPSSETGKRWQHTHPLSKRSIQLRRDLSIHKRITDAVIYISGLGHYELTLNGEKLGNAQFDPMWSDYDKTIYYNAFEVTDQLKNNNTIGVLLGNGFYNQQGGRYVKMQVSFGPPTLLFLLRITYKDGSIEDVCSDEHWKYDLSPLIFNDMYGGEDYDARLEQEGWNRFGFDDSSWQSVVLQSAPNGQLRPQTTDPIQIMETFTAQSIKKVGDAYLFDMGQNLSGFPRFRVQGKAGDVIRLTVGENIHEDGTVNQSQSGSPYYYEYTLKGGVEEIWHPRFSYYGYRYIQVDGAKPENVGNLPSDNTDNEGSEKIFSSADDVRDIPLIKEMESCFVYNSSPQAGTFHSSNEIFNNANQLITNAIKSNMHAVFTDCPHREKLGWLEQVHLNGPGLFYNFDLTTFAPKIMQDIRDAQLPNGLVPDIAPEYVIFDGGFRDSPEWGSTSVILPFFYYQFYGDNSLILEYYDVMKRYVDYLTSTATDHIVSHGLGDWCDYREDQPYGVSHNTPVALSATTHYYMVIDYMIQAAEIAGSRQDQTLYAKLRDEVRAAFNRKFFDAQTYQYGSGSQASNAMPLFAGIVEPQYKQAVLDNLVKDIEAKGYRLSTGDVGNRYLFQTLADNGLNELLYKMHNHREVPGYGFQLQFGATTLTELWDPRAGASWNHFMMGQILEWFYKSLAGIRMDYDPQTRDVQSVIIAPKLAGDLTHVSASYETLYGWISVDWRTEGDLFMMELSLPFNCKAKVYLPQDKDYEMVQSGTYTFRKKLKKPVIQQETYALFPPVKELQKEVHHTDSLFGLLVSKVTNPTLTAIVPNSTFQKKSAVIICPGGGYQTLLMEKEGTQVAQEFAKQGIAAFVLKYRLPGMDIGVTDPFAPLKDTQRAIQMVRDNTDSWGIDPSKVGIMGFSAGGHLAATLGVHYDSVMIDQAEASGLRPDFLILINPVISFDEQTGHSGSRKNLLGANEDEQLIHFFSNHLHVNRQTPKSILFHTSDDQVVSVRNSSFFYQQLHDNGIPAEMHIYSRGDHGFINFPEFNEWFPRLIRWMKMEDLK